MVTKNIGIVHSGQHCPEQVKASHPATYADLYQVCFRFRFYSLPELLRLREVLPSTLFQVERTRWYLPKKSAFQIRIKGRAHPERSGFEGAWTKDPLKFDNSYFKQGSSRGSQIPLLCRALRKGTSVVEVEQEFYLEFLLLQLWHCSLQFPRIL
ncbi:hypothetical protein V6N13_127107 [Hibiscus sabdariffa]